MNAGEGLIAEARRSGLLAAGLEPGPEIPAACDTRASALAWLLEQRLLTAFQAEELLAGRGDECVLSGRYRLEERLGAGATGTVYRAWDATAARVVAVKVLPPDCLVDETTAARFRREAKALMRLSHPSIVAAYGAEEDRGRHFLVMEYAEGRDLLRLIQERGRIPPTEAADYGYQLAIGLAHAHEHGLIHRDLKPANLVVTPDRRVKILDLGLARFVLDTITDPSLTSEGMGLGTPDYAAPEQFKNAHSADARSDVYALGCTLHHAITGAVPFPGTSLAEKYAAHLSQEPPSVASSAPECPAGLALVLRKMMAKEPADRFASARETAEALGAYISASSVVEPAMAATASWKGSSLVLAPPRPAPKTRRTRPLAAALGVALAVLGAWALLGGPESPSTPTAEAEPVPAEEGVLTVSQDGRGRFRTINQALVAVKPGNTIRILDHALYRERLKFAGEEHEGVTLEATDGATLEVPPSAPGPGVLVLAARVTLRGLTIRGPETAILLCVGARGACGVVLDDLDLAGAGGPTLLQLDRTAIPDDQAPIVVRRCVFRGAQKGIEVLGRLVERPQESHLCRRLVVIDNHFVSCQKGIVLVGGVQDALVAGNRVSGGGEYGAVQFMQLSSETRGVLLANNTFSGVGIAIRVWQDDGAPRGADVEIRNNAIVGPGPVTDVQFLVSDDTDLKGPGDVAALRDRWAWAGNWRREASSAPHLPEHGGRVPMAAGDRVVPHLGVLALDPASPDFLRPAADSPLATGGVASGGLPGWAGAVEPEGQAPFDWDRFAARWMDRVLTVSKDPADGGRFRTLNDAVEAARPRCTIRVLDEGPYEESITLDRPSVQAGITLESARGAAWNVPVKASGALLVRGVPRVTVRGFRLSGATAYLVRLEGLCSAARFEGLTLFGGGKADGISIQGAVSAAGEAPILVRDCRLSRTHFAMSVAGPSSASESLPTARVALLDNHLLGAAMGIVLRGEIRQVLVAGNRISGVDSVALQLDTLLPSSSGVVLAHNTVQSSAWAFRLWDQEVRPGQVRIVGNVFVAKPGYGDLGFYDSGGSRTTARGPGTVQSVLDRWRVERNARVVRVPPSDEAVVPYWIPVAPTDHHLSGAGFLSEDPDAADFLRPAAGSRLAVANVGFDPALPGYVGAVPPVGGTAWDFEAAFDALTK